MLAFVYYGSIIDIRPNKMAEHLQSVSSPLDNNQSHICVKQAPKGKS